MNTVILASQSPRRKQLLEWADINFEVIVSNTDETFPEDIAIEEIPIYVAKEKAEAVQKKISTNDSIIIAADTVVVIGDKILGKPVDEEEAIHFLQLLSGKTHRVITGVVIVKDKKQISFHDITEVEFNVLTDTQITYYVSKYKPFDKAGAYAIQEWIGVIGIKKISGDFYNVMGLPVNRVIEELNNL